MKKIILVIALCTLVLTGCTKTSEKTKIVHITDLHYLSQQLTENSPAFVDLMYNSDGKMTHYIDQITDAFVWQMLKEKPDVVLVGGDLTFNGELLSHKDLAEKFKILEDNGIQVLIIPGNHDVDYPFSYGYGETQFYRTDRTTKEEFTQIYDDFGYSQAYSKDKDSLSYFYKINSYVTVLALDTNTNGNGNISEDTFAWIEAQLKKLKKGTSVIALTHQNLLVHNERFTGGYVINENERLTELFYKYGVDLNLSGHLHIQHISGYENTLYDIATESFAVYPSKFGVITVDCENAAVEYITELTEVSKWAEENNVTDKNLLDFAIYSKDFFTRTSINRCMTRLAEDGGTESENQQIAWLFSTMNNYYFPGNMPDIAQTMLDSEQYKLLLEKGESVSTFNYIKSVLNSPMKDYNSWSGKLY